MQSASRAFCSECDAPAAAHSLGCHGGGVRPRGGGGGRGGGADRANALPCHERADTVFVITSKDLDCAGLNYQKRPESKKGAEFVP